jgi:methylase of polypeptide subunit release factors
MLQSLSATTDFYEVPDGIRSLCHADLVKERAKYLIARHRSHIGTYRVQFHGMNLDILPDVFCPNYGEGSDLLAKNLAVMPGERVLDMGTGSGALGLLAARMGAKVVATDLSEQATVCARANAQAQEFGKYVDVRQGNLFHSLADSETFSLVLFNLPFMEGTASDLLQLAMYDAGWRTLKGFFSGLRRHLSPEGRALVAFSNCGDVRLLHEHCKLNHFQIKQMARLQRDLEFYVYEITRSL